MIVPQLAAGAAPGLDDLRRSCDAAVARLGAAGPDLVVQYTVAVWTPV